jgi:hypothetical protein
MHPCPASVRRSCARPILCSPKLVEEVKSCELRHETVRKGCEQRSDLGFGWYTEGEMDQEVPLWRPAGLLCKRVRGFSDSFMTAFSEVDHSFSETGLGFYRVSG